MNLEYRIPDNGLQLAKKWTCEVVVFEKDFDGTEENDQGESYPLLTCNLFRTATDKEAYYDADRIEDITSMQRQIVVTDGTDTDGISELIAKVLDPESSTSYMTTNSELIDFKSARDLK